MGLFFTGKGDGGISDLGYGKKIDKTSSEVVAVGELDELNALLGLIRSISQSDTKTVLKSVQNDLFTIQANIADIMYEGKLKAPPFTEEKVKWLEVLINELELKVQPEKGFIVSGENESAAWLDYARAVSRRTERALLRLNKEKTVAAPLLAYLNRLSSLLFALARGKTMSEGTKEDHPNYQ